MAAKPEIIRGACNEAMGKSQQSCNLTVRLPETNMTAPDVPVAEMECLFFGSCVLAEAGPRLTMEDGE